MYGTVEAAVQYLHLGQAHRHGFTQNIEVHFVMFKLKVVVMQQFSFMSQKPGPAALLHVLGVVSWEVC